MQLQNDDSLQAFQQQLCSGILYLHCALNEEELVYNSNEPIKWDDISSWGSFFNDIYNKFDNSNVTDLQKMVSDIKKSSS